MARGVRSDAIEDNNVSRIIDCYSTGEIVIETFFRAQRVPHFILSATIGAMYVMCLRGTLRKERNSISKHREPPDQQRSTPSNPKFWSSAIYRSQLHIEPEKRKEKKEIVSR